MHQHGCLQIIRVCMLPFARATLHCDYVNDLESGHEAEFAEGDRTVLWQRGRYSNGGGGLGLDMLGEAGGGGGLEGL
jgi:hypothetical protein